jgi:hypothetical protein
MDEEKKAFRFLSEDEFLQLSDVEKAEYLSGAAEELENRERKLRECIAQLQQLTKEHLPKG